MPAVGLSGLFLFFVLNLLPNPVDISRVALHLHHPDLALAAAEVED